MRGLSLFTICCALAANYACDNRTALHPPPSGEVTVAIDPPMQNIDIGATKRFSAIVNGTANKEVSWSISGPGCVDNACG